MVNKVVIPSAMFKAFNVCAGNKDIRPYLNGICLELSSIPDYSSYMVATDGHRLLFSVINPNWVDVKTSGEYIIPRDLCEAIAKIGKGKQSVDITLEFNLNDDGFSAGGGGLFLVSKVITGYQFPDWRRVVDSLKNLPESVGNYNLEYMGDMYKVAKYLDPICSKSVPSYKTMNDSSLFEFGDSGVMGVLMGYRKWDAPKHPYISARIKLERESNHGKT